MSAMRTLPSGRQVFDTGRLMIGIRAEPRRADQGSHAELLQRVLCAEIAREWHPTPPIVHTSPTLWQRVQEWFR